ncbi:HK97 major tail subunit [uncultured Candidatus Thioglobus sp.]|nr:HK97 major tail subunit [uncultured Candidatus Thioglobus sp.]
MMNINSIVSPQASLGEFFINETYYVNETAMFVCNSKGGPNNTYQWQANGTDLDGEISQNLTRFNVTSRTGGLYTCVVSNEGGNHSASTFMFVYPYIVIEPPGSVTVSIESSVLLVCYAESFPSPTYLWFRADDGSIREGILTNGSSLSISRIQDRDQGGYYCNTSARGITVQSQVAIITGMIIIIFTHD